MTTTNTKQQLVKLGYTFSATRNGYKVSVRTGKAQTMRDGSYWNGLETIGVYSTHAQALEAARATQNGTL